MPLRQLCAVALAAVFVLVGCSSGPAEAPPAASSTGPLAGEDPHAGDALDPGEATAVPTWDEAAADSAGQVALQAMGAFARRDLSAEAWYEQLAGYLTGPAQAAFYGTDPAEVPVTVVLGVEAISSPSAYLAEVTVGTDAGPYTVLAAREGAERPWKVERIEPAA